MSEQVLISPMLDNFVMGEPISDHHGVRCCPAMEQDTEDKYIVKVISSPASPVQLEALLLSGAYPDKASALAYFRALTDDVVQEAELLKQLSQMEGFAAMEHWQVEALADNGGYEVYLLSPYRHSLERYLQKNTMTHLGAVNLGLDLCAALTVCRRFGYMYADLKPSNIFIMGNQHYCIGDLGFLSLASLKFASLPDKYKSAYTAPEIADAFSTLNTTMDVYSLGLILYRVYNGGTLPFTENTAPSESFPAPLYADYEMAEIILKACAPNTQDRWQDPMELGQALVSYMQRNGANDVPIVPAPIPEQEADREEAAVQTSQDEVPAEALEAAAAASLPTAADAEAEAIPDNEDDFDNLSFLDDTAAEEVLAVTDGEVLEGVSEEVSDMLEQADVLIAHPVPEPVVAPEPIDVPIPEPITPEEEAKAETDSGAEEDTPDTGENTEADNNVLILDDSEDGEEGVAKKKKSGVWFRVTMVVLIFLILLATAACGVFYYRYYYLQDVQSIVLDGNETSLTVSVDSDIDESILTVICSDFYGNKLEAPVVGGKATFTNLVPDTAYTIQVTITGFHQLTGNYSTAYSTPKETKIVQLHAVTGAENGSVILGFTIDGTDSDEWTVTYAAPGEEEKSSVFSGHMVTLTGLTVGKEYTLHLAPEDNLYVSGTEEIKFTASNLIYAQNLVITESAGGKLSAQWAAAEGSQVPSWTVRCFNEDGFDETQVVEDTAVTFENVDHSKPYTVEVTAAGMSVNERVFITANALTATNFKADTAEKGQITLTWECTAIPQSGWLLTYTVNGTLQPVLTCTENTIVLTEVTPGATYAFTLQDPAGTTVLGNFVSCTVPA